MRGCAFHGNFAIAVGTKITGTNQKDTISGTPENDAIANILCAGIFNHHYHTVGRAKKNEKISKIELQILIILLVNEILCRCSWRWKNGFYGK
jgi:hypothetical protein